MFLIFITRHFRWDFTLYFCVIFSWLFCFYPSTLHRSNNSRVACATVQQLNLSPFYCLPCLRCTLPGHLKQQKLVAFIYTQQVWQQFSKLVDSRREQLELIVLTLMTLELVTSGMLNYKVKHLFVCAPLEFVPLRGVDVFKLTYWHLSVTFFFTNFLLISRCKCI